MSSGACWLSAYRTMSGDVNLLKLLNKFENEAQELKELSDTKICSDSVFADRRSEMGFCH